MKNKNKGIYSPYTSSSAGKSSGNSFPEAADVIYRRKHRIITFVMVEEDEN